MNRTNKTRRNSRRNLTLRSRNPPSTTLSYHGPTSLPQEELATSLLITDAPATSLASGMLSDVFADTPFTSPDWASFAQIYSEYRVLSFKVRFHPLVTGATVGTILYNVVYVVWSASSSITALTTYADASNFPVKRVFSLNQPTSLSHRMTGVEEAAFVDVTAPTVDYTFKFFSTGLTPSTNYGRYTLEYLCQFRARK